MIAVKVAAPESQPVNCREMRLGDLIDLPHMGTKFRRAREQTVIPPNQLSGRRRAVQRSIHDAHGEDCTDAAEGDAMPAI